MSWTQDDLEPPMTGTVTGKVRSDYPLLTDAEFEALQPVPVDLTTATAVTAHIERADATVFSRAVVPATDQTTNPGQWSMALVEGDLSAHGDYTAQIRVTWAGERPQTFGLVTFPVARKIP